MTNRNRQPWRAAAAARGRAAGLGAALAPAVRVASIAGIARIARIAGIAGIAGIACIVCIAAIACLGCGRGGGTGAGGSAAPAGAAAAGGPAAGPLPDACELLTQADVETITQEVSGSLSSTLEDAVGKDPGQCTFSLAGSVPPRVISLALRRAASVEQAAARQQADESGLRSLGSGAPVEDLPRLGDGAFWIGGQIDQLHVRHGDTLLVFTVQVDKNPLRAATTLAGKALARLAKPAPPAARPAGPAPPAGAAAAETIPLAAQVPAPAAPHAYVSYALPAPGPAAAPDPLLPAFPDARSAGLDQDAFTHLMLRANLFHSDAVVILADGRLVADARFGKPREPIEVSSIAKSVTGLAIGRLLYTGKIRSLDQPVATWYREWSHGPKQAITLRQLMNHTSGLAARPTPEEVYASSDLVRQALAADLADPPGSRFFYNDKAVNLLAGIVEKASGKKLDVYLRDEIFAPLGISRFAWMRDPAGNPHVLAGLQLDALDLARIGQLMLDGGVYQGKRLLEAGFVRDSVHAAQPFSPTGGLLWWVIPEWTRLVVDQRLLDSWRRGGADPAFLAALAPLAGREIPREELFGTLDRAFGHDQALTLWVRNVPARNLPTPRVEAGPPVGFVASGALGQYLVVLPAARIVAVRQLRQPRQTRVSGDDFEAFPDLVRALLPARSARH